MFSFSKKPATPELPNKVWKTKEECLRGIGSAAMRQLLDGGSAIVVTFFEEEARLCGEFFSTNRIPFRMISSSNVTAFAPKELALIVAQDIVASAQVHGAIQSMPAPLLLFRGRYPIPATEGAVLAVMPLKKDNAAFYVSMEDEFLKTFGMEKMIGLMEQLGMKDDECVEHGFVDKAITSAQRKLAEKKSDYKCRSEVEWFQRNVHSKL